MSTLVPAVRQPLSRRAIAGLFLLACLPFLNALPADFTYDDRPIIKDNPRLASPKMFPQIFTTHYFGGPLTSGTAYRPLVLVTYAVQKWIHGNRSWAFRVVNIALHGGVTVLLAMWLLALGFPRGPSVATAALFAVSTIHVEAVTSLVGRAELLAAFLVMSSALAFHRATASERLRVAPYLLCLALFQAAVFVKENAIILPGVVFLGLLFRTDVAGPPLARLRRAALPLLGVFGPVVVLFAVRFIALEGFLFSKKAGIFDLENSLVAQPRILRMANACTLIVRYVEKTFLPIGLSADHSAHALPLATKLSQPLAWAGVLFLVSVSLAALLLLARRPLFGLGWALFLGALFPTSNVPFPIGTIYAERLAYLPSAGLLMMAVALLSPLVRSVPLPRPWPVREALLSVAVLLYGAGTVHRNLAWADDQALFGDMVEKVPRSAKAHYDFAFDASRRGEKRLARTHLLRATRIFPRHYEAWAFLGRLHWDEKRLPSAIAAYRRGVEIFPDFENGRWGLAKSLEASGDLAGALAQFDEGARRLPSSYPISYHRARLLSELGRKEEALKAWLDAVADGKGAAIAELGLAKALFALSREEEGLVAARRALVKQPTYREVRVLLAERYLLAMKPLPAAAELARAVRGTPKDPEAATRLFDLALAHPEARGHARRVLPLVRKVFGKVPTDPSLGYALARFEELP